MLSYVYFGTNNLDKVIAFYNAILAPLDMKRCVTGDAECDRIAAGWGIYEDGGARSSHSGLANHLINSLLRWATVAWSRSARARGKRSTTSVPPLWQMGASAAQRRQMQGGTDKCHLQIS
jgi:hypothetical protein